MGLGRGSRNRKWWISAGLALAVILVGLVLLWVKAPALYGPSNEAKIATSNTRAGILTVAAALIAGTAAGAAVWINRRTLAETQRANREEDQRERYATAIGQLGSAQRSVRLGAIYTLERIAEYSESDQRTVVEVLSAYIREKRPRSVPKKRDAPLQGEDRKRDEALRRLPTDEAAALTVLGRLRWCEDAPLILATDSSNTDLGYANLSRAIFSGRNLRADFQRTDFSNTDLGYANLPRTSFFGANLSRAALLHTKLSEAELSAADLSGASLDGANLSRSFLYAADLSGPSLDGANLSGADLSGARNLHQYQINSARGDLWNKLPDALQRPSSWAGSRDEGPQ